MMLTGQRENEVAGLRRSEIDVAERLWTIPAWRYKTGRLHLVPLADGAMEVLHETLRTLPAGHGACLFSVDNGQTPLADFTKPVLAFKKRVLAALCEAQPGAEMDHWQLEDTRRTVRTHLARLKVPHDVCEAILGHAKKDLNRVYNQYRYLSERREALVLWENRILPERTERDDHPTGRPSGTVGAAEDGRGGRPVR